MSKQREGLLGSTGISSNTVGFPGRDAPSNFTYKGILKAAIPVSYLAIGLALGLYWTV